MRALDRATEPYVQVAVDVPETEAVLKIEANDENAAPFQYFPVA